MCQGTLIRVDEAWIYPGLLLSFGSQPRRASPSLYMVIVVISAKQRNVLVPHQRGSTDFVSSAVFVVDAATLQTGWMYKQFEVIA